MSPSHGRWKWIAEVAAISAIAGGLAWYISTTAPFGRISAVVSDEISRALGFSSNEPVVLVRLARDFSKPDLENLFANAIPALVSKSSAAVLGIDIDFSGRQFDVLAKRFRDWSQDGHQNDANRVIWSIGFQRSAQGAADPGPMEPCQSCEDTNCLLRFNPRPVFGGDLEPSNYGLAYVWNDASGMSRASFRFVCSADTTAPLKTFHFKLIETYCAQNPTRKTCMVLQQNSQNITWLRSWFLATPVDLCALVDCNPGRTFGSPLPNPPVDVNGKIVILYSDVEGNDEHATIAGTRKGAEVEASLAVAELVFGASDVRVAEAAKLALEFLLTVCLAILFHWSYTKDFAIIPAGLVFVLYLYLALKLSGWIPDFRDYALAVTLVVIFEIYLKAAFQALGKTLERLKLRRRRLSRPSETI